MFVTFVLIFKFILIYLLHVLFVFKIKGIFGNKSPTQNVLKVVVSFNIVKNRITSGKTDTIVPVCPLFLLR